MGQHAYNQCPLAPPLALVTCGLLRADARLASLDGVVALFTQYLDVSPLVSLPEAAAKGSVRLFDCVATRVLADTTSNKAHVDFWFARALQAALEKDDLAILKRIHAFHLAPLYVSVPVIPPVLYATSLGVAFKSCTLETVQWLIENRADRACCSPGVRNFCRGCVLEATRSFGDRDAFRIIVWLFESGILSKASPKGTSQALWRPMQLSSRLARWAVDQQLLSQEASIQLIYSVISQGRAHDAMELLDLINAPMPAASARSLLMLASFRGLSDVAEKLISQGHCREFQHKFVFAPSGRGAAKLVQWGREFMDERGPDHEPAAAWICCETASRCGNLVALQWLFHERGVPPNPSQLVSDVEDESTVLQVYAWMHAMWMELPISFMDSAAGKGLLNVVKWLHTHSPAGCTSAAMDSAAGHGHLEVVQWLHTNRSEGCTTHALNSATNNGHLHVVQWLLQHYPHTSDVPEAIRHAAAFGQLDVLVWLTHTYPEEMCTRCIADSVLNGTLMSMGRVKSIDVLRWNDSQRVVLCGSCRATAARHLCGAMISLSYEGDLEMCKYLYRFHREKLHFADPAKTVRRVAQGGHLGMLQWIDATFGGHDVDEMDRWDRDWTAAIEEAEEFDQDHILAWIHGIRAADYDVGDEDSLARRREPESPLALVRYGLLRADPRLVPLRHVVAFFTQLLDILSLISLTKAAAMGSVRLFNRVASRFMMDTTLDRPQIDYWFARAMQAALEQDDLAMVQRIHALYPEPLFVHVPSVPKILYTDALGLAFKYGTVETVQWFVEHRSDRACCAPGIRNFCRACLEESLRSVGDRDPFRIAKWLFDCGLVNMVNEHRVMDSMFYFMHKSPAVIRWLDEQKLLSRQAAYGQLDYAIRERRAQNTMALLDFMASPMEVGFAEKCLLAASFAGLDNVAEKLISRGHCDQFQHKFRLAPATDGGKNLVQLGAAFMKKKMPRSGSTRAEVCCDAATSAGNLEALQ